MAETRSAWWFEAEMGWRGDVGDAKDGARMRFEMHPLDELLFQDEII